MEPTTGPYQSKRKSILRPVQRIAVNAVALRMIEEMEAAGCKVSRTTKRTLKRGMRELSEAIGRYDSNVKRERP